MTIPVTITREGSTFFANDEVRVDAPIETWQEHDLFDLCDKMQNFIGQRGLEQPIRRCKKVASGYVITVVANSGEVTTTKPIAMPEHLATAEIWAN